jgi:hypothetical protein
VHDIEWFFNNPVFAFVFYMFGQSESGWLAIVKRFKLQYKFPFTDVDIVRIRKILAALV